ncbi:MAG: hypothetical protein DRP71_05855 [Verrucomicrobia bacterium]|nr:MAG: hypothetical protein DRP71_05855 [Verrucomicrobiota bacterium]
MIVRRALSTAFLVCIAGVSNIAAQGHDVYVCASLDVNFVLGSNQNPQNGLYRLRSDGSWQHLGINDPYSTALSVDPRDADVVHIATLSGALRSVDGGVNWRIMTSWHMTQPRDICVDPNEPDTVYLALPDGVAVSSDKGMTWDRRDNGLPDRGKFTQTIEVDRTQAGRVLAGCESGIYLTEDGALSWSRVMTTEETVDDIQQSPHDKDIWLAVTQSAGGWKSEDAGVTWTGLRGVPSGATLYNVTFDPTDPMRMAIGSWTYGVYTSEDGGQTWRTRNAGLPQFHHVWRVGVHPDTGRLYASVTQSDLYLSDDFGRTWEKGGFDGSKISDFEFVPRN